MNEVTDFKRKQMQEPENRVSEKRVMAVRTKRLTL